MASFIHTEVSVDDEDKDKNNQVSIFIMFYS